PGRVLMLGFDLRFADLYERAGLQKVASAFLSELVAADAPLHARLQAARIDPATLERKQHSQLLIDLAPHLEDFIGALFGITPEIRALAARHHELAPLYEVKRQFIQRSAAKAYSEQSAQVIPGAAISAELAV